MAKGATGVLVRAALWVVLAVFFLVRDAMKMQAARSAGQPVTVWMGLQFLLWGAVLGFWVYAGWRGWKARG